MKCKSILDTPRYNAKNVTDYNSVKGENTSYIYDIKFPRKNLQTFIILSSTTWYGLSLLLQINALKDYMR